MPRYHTIKGVVLTSICGEFSLVCATALRKSLSPVAQLNESSAFLWRLLESGADKGELEKAVMAEYEIDDLRRHVRQSMRFWIRCSKPGI